MHTFEELLEKMKSMSVKNNSADEYLELAKAFDALQSLPVAKYFRRYCERMALRFRKRCIVYFIKAGNFAVAEKFSTALVEKHPEDIEVWICVLLSTLKIQSLVNLWRMDLNAAELELFQQVLDLSEGALKVALQSCMDKRENRLHEERGKAFVKSLGDLSALPSEKLDETYKRLSEFEGIPSVDIAMERILEMKKTRQIRESRYSALKRQFANMSVDRNLEAEYCSLRDGFKKFSDFSDSKEYMRKCEKNAEIIRKREEKKTLVILLVFIGIVAACIAGCYIYGFIDEKIRISDSGCELLAEGDYDGFFEKGMVKVEPGTFNMGEGNEMHRVTLTHAYWISKTEVTQGQWEAIMGNNPSSFKNGDNYPVENVSWYDVQEFLKKLNEKYADKLPAGYKFDLPTEAQWEYAAQGGHMRQEYTKYAGGSNLDEVGWWSDNSSGETHLVCQKNPNELGLYDMSGNVEEWCRDWFASDILGVLSDPVGTPTGVERAIRGGNWNGSNGCGIMIRGHYNPEDSLNIHGLRLVISNTDSAIALFEKQQNDIGYKHLEKEDYDSFWEHGMVKVEPGTFIMSWGKKEEHSVQLTHPYWIAKTEVTQGQWQAIMGKNPSKFKRLSNYPVECVSWYDVQEFLEKLNEKYANKLPEGYKFDLPTMVQWEYAAQGGHERQNYTSYAGSDNPDEVGWYKGNSYDRTHPVAMKKPNELGLYDMSGNVEEWCRDRIELNDSKDTYIAIRGGSCYADYSPVAALYCGSPAGATHQTGIRLAVTNTAYLEEKAEAERINLLGYNELVKEDYDAYLEKGMVKVEPGTFIMACRDGENERDEERHQATLTQSYWMAKTEVTQGQWKAVMGDNPLYFKNGDDYPVENVSWEDVQIFLQKLNEKYADKLPEGYQFNLPTEAQWEYAAQGGHKRSRYTKYAGSNELDGVGWYDGNSGSKTHPVGQKTPNELGLYDMSGNVLEWCRDWYGAYNGDATDPCGPAKGSSRVLRGGSRSSYASYCRCAYRSYYDGPSYRRSDDIGFRLVLSPILTTEQIRIAREKAEQERIAREKAEQERIAREKAEKERVEQAYNNLMANMVQVEPGTFTMAHRDGENERDEKRHQVTLTQSYWMAKTEVTQGQWKAVMGDNPSHFKNGDNYPVEHVSWNDVQEFLKKIE